MIVIVIVMMKMMMAITTILTITTITRNENYNTGENKKNYMLTILITTIVLCRS